MVDTPDSPSLETLCDYLSSRADQWRTTNDWPREALAACATAGVYRWFMPQSAGGLGWNDVDQTRGYLRLAAADLTTTFIITQFIGACRRIGGSENRQVADRWLPRLISGDAFATVGISHLTTSRRHLGKPVLSAITVDQSPVRYRLTGVAPWVTGGAHADVVVLAATMPDGRELLAAVPTDLPGVECGGGADLVALSASCTDQVALHDVEITAEHLIAGPVNEVMKSGVGAGTGGLQTSTLAVGLARAAVNYLKSEAVKRTDLCLVAETMQHQADELQQRLLLAASGQVCDASEIRGDANRFVMRTTQAAMTAAKGAGYVQGHPVGRWCREALFFLVWSCPQPVASAQMCELAGIAV
ncbi:MAG TPA: acyl-CoA dehydrogenase [Planctomycetaceae bacterium]|nr:acyl-CoA dehydrogenase [Planctomycetaceae bacterium]